jgi:hypothetical protein
VASLLLDLAIGVHHFAMYPSDHPALDSSVDTIMGRLSHIFVDHRTFTIGVADRQLIVEGAVTDPSHAALSELARRLHKHQLGAVVFDRGVKAKEVREALTVLSVDAEIHGTPVGLLPPDEFPAWEDMRLERIGYEDLELIGGAAKAKLDRPMALWLELAMAAMPDSPLSEEGPAGEALAAHLREHGDDKRDESIAAYVRQLAHELRGARGHDADQVQQRLSELLVSMDDETLQGIAHCGGSSSRRNKFVLDANQSLSADAVLKILQAAAERSEQGISSSMTRLLSKLAVHATEGDGEARSMADTAVRDNVEALMEGWQLKDPNPGAYTLQLDAMSRAAPIFQAAETDEPLTGAKRLIQMALEVDADGLIIGKAVPDFLSERGMRALLDLLDQAPPGSRVAESIRTDLSTPETLRRLLVEDKLDQRSLDVMVTRLGVGAVEPLLDVLEDSESRAVRRMVFDALAEMGPTVAEHAVSRLEDAEWFVLRNILTLMQRLDPLPDGFDAWPYLEHSNSRVRRAALPLVLRTSERRDRALTLALKDEEELMVRMALLELAEGVPEELQQFVDRVVLDLHRSDDIRALGAKVLAGSDAPSARDTLHSVAVIGKTLILRRPRLASKSAVLLAALGGLVRSWPEDAQVRALARSASRSKDEEIRAAVEITEEVQP